MKHKASYIDQLEGKIRELMQLLSSLKNSNDLLFAEIERLQSSQADSEELGQIAALEEEVRSLKKENKTLKEKQKLIQNKAERLVHKLDQLNV